ncbi:unnamed protein product [Prorocentrum cordatum]|uniref:Secreted protein n=2 Tax=Prorocentrum cordatum TaxID=2364126 RepID=A0ABN9U2W0_9DINO|nr:unnamed protein product [Polarella glacialis]
MQRDPVCHSRLGVLGLSGGLAGGLRLLTASWFSSLGWWLFHAPEGSRHLHDENTVFDGDGGVIPRSDSPPSPLPSCPPAPGRHHRAPSGVHTGTDIGPESGAYAFCRRLEGVLVLFGVVVRRRRCCCRPSSRCRCRPLSSSSVVVVVVVRRRRRRRSSSSSSSS